MSEHKPANAGSAGTIDVGGDLTVNRLGFGAMRITGHGIWGEPASRDEPRRRSFAATSNWASTSSTPRTRTDPTSARS